MDEIYYDTCPYEYPLIVSRTAQICYFPDFFNKTRNIVIEWDESAHKYGHRATKDKRRDSQIMRKYPGIKIIRIDEDLIDKVKYIREQL
jgi:very-short-patch-repair endonuclease